MTEASIFENESIAIGTPLYQALENLVMRSRQVEGSLYPSYIEISEPGEVVAFNIPRGLDKLDGVLVMTPLGEAENVDGLGAVWACYEEGKISFKLIKMEAGFNQPPIVINKEALTSLGTGRVESLPIDINEGVQLKVKVTGDGGLRIENTGSERVYRVEKEVVEVMASDFGQDLRETIQENIPQRMEALPVG